jgi:hypothetical protein
MFVSFLGLLFLLGLYEFYYSSCYWLFIKSAALPFGKGFVLAMFLGSARTKVFVWG